MCNRSRRTRGAAAIEFVLMVPVLLALLAGTITFALAGYAKFRMSDAAMIAVRRCVAQNPAACGATVQGLATNRWTAAATVCNGNLRTTVTDSNNIVTVTASCAFVGGLMQSYLGLSNLNITTSAAMPY